MQNCQNLPALSSGPSQRRIHRATRMFGSESVSRILAFALYLLGSSRKALAEFVGVRADTVKSLVQRVFRDGLPALEDRRRKTSTFLPHGASPKTPYKILLDERDVVVRFDEARQIRLPRDNPVQCRTVLLSLLESKLVSLGEVAEAIGLSTERTRKLRKQLADGDVDALLDQRRGQLRDYRMTPEVKAELIQQYVLNLQTHAGTSSQQLSQELAKRCEIQVADRTIRQHVAMLGLGRIRKSLPELLAALKKTPEGDRAGQPEIGTGP